MIEKYARHTGHADLLRERLDSSTADNLARDPIAEVRRAQGAGPSAGRPRPAPGHPRPAAPDAGPGPPRTPVEVKAGSRISGEDFRGLRQLKDRLGPQLEEAIILHTGEHAYTHDDWITVLPLDRLWASSGRD